MKPLDVAVSSQNCLNYAVNLKNTIERIVIKDANVLVCGLSAAKVDHRKCCVLQIVR